VLINPGVAAGAEPAISLSLTYAGSDTKATAIEATAKQVTFEQITTIIFMLLLVGAANWLRLFWHLKPLSVTSTLALFCLNKLL
jgi:hypothetical protein